MSRTEPLSTYESCLLNSFLGVLKEDATPKDYDKFHATCDVLEAAEKLTKAVVKLRSLK